MKISKEKFKNIVAGIIIAMFIVGSCIAHHFLLALYITFFGMFIITWAFQRLDGKIENFIDKIFNQE